MKLARRGVVAAVLLAVATMAWAQKTDFSGTWTLVPAGAPPASGGGVLGNGPATVRQSADTLTVERALGDDTITLTYKLDGSDSRNTIAGRDGQSIDSMSTVRWQGPTLTIVTRQETSGQIVQSTDVWTVEGSTLTVETTDARGTQKRAYNRSRQ